MTSTGDNDGDFTVTLVHGVTGHAEVISVDSSTTTVQQVWELAHALLGDNDNNNNDSSALFHNGRRLTRTMTLQQAGVPNGDLLVLADAAAPSRRSAAAAAAPMPASNTAATSSGGLLDFSNLLASAPPTAVAPTTTTTAPTTTVSPVYFPGMSLNDAMAYNPHPQAIVPLLLDKEHLWKELHYHNPKLALAVKQQPNTAAAISAWRQQVVQGAVTQAVQQTQQFHTQRRMQQQLDANPADPEAVAYFEQQKSKAAVQQQFQEMMQEYPESLAKVLMLYVSAKINGHAIQAFCDSGAQSTIMSKRLAQEVGLLSLVDDRFAGTAVGVGTGKILGRIHLVQLELTDGSTNNNNTYYFPCTVTVMDDPAPGATEMPFLLGLDMMKRHLCKIDLEQHVLQFRIGSSSDGPEKTYMQVPFLHEKDLDAAQGGTRGFDAEQANAQLLKEQEKDDQGDDEGESNKMDE